MAAIKGAQLGMKVDIFLLDVQSANSDDDYVCS